MDVAEEYDYDYVAERLVEEIYERIVFSPEWFEDGDVPAELENNAKIDGWFDVWTDELARAIEKGVKSGKIKVDDDYRKFLKNIKVSEVRGKISKARSELNGILAGEELDESRQRRGRMLKEARKKEKKRPVESDFDVTEEQMLELEDALGDERLYGGGIEDAAVKVNAKKSGRNVIFAEISVYVLCDGDFGEDEDGNFITDPRWIKFDIDNAYKFYYGLNPDKDDTEEEWYCAGTTHYTDDDVMAIFEEDVTDYVQTKF